jgi:hypothetical protein
VLLQRLCSDSVSFTPPKISELAGDCIAEDPETRPTLADVAPDISRVGSVGDGVLAHTTDEAAEQAEIASGSMRSSGDAQQCDPMEPGEGSRPLFSSEAMKTMPDTKRSSR